MMFNDLREKQEVGKVLELIADSYYKASNYDDSDDEECKQLEQEDVTEDFGQINEIIDAGGLEDDEEEKKEESLESNND